MLRVRWFVSDLLQSNMFAVEEDDGHALLIDPCRNTEPAKALTADAILLTHEHYDHVSGVNAWKELTGAPVICSEACANRLGDPRATICKYFDILVKLQTRYVVRETVDVDRMYVCAADRVFTDRYTMDWRGHTVEMFEIPGHSPGSIGIVIDRRMFFSGDSLIEDCAVELRLPGSSKNDWLLKGQYRLAAVPHPITVYPGHMAPFVWDGKMPPMELRPYEPESLKAPDRRGKKKNKTAADPAETE